MLVHCIFFLVLSLSHIFNWASIPGRFIKKTIDKNVLNNFNYLITILNRLGLERLYLICHERLSNTQFKRTRDPKGGNKSCSKNCPKLCVSFYQTILKIMLFKIYFIGILCNGFFNHITLSFIPFKRGMIVPLAYLMLYQYVDKTLMYQCSLVWACLSIFL